MDISKTNLKIVEKDNVISNTCDNKFLSKDRRQNLANIIVAFVQENVALCHDQNKIVYALDNKTGEVRRIDSMQFRDWLISSFYNIVNKSIPDKTLREVISTLTGIGRYSSQMCSVYRRTAKHQNCYYLDLCQPGNSNVIEIYAGGWNIIDKSPVKFLRSDTMHPLPVPIRNGQLAALWTMCNIPSSVQLLVITYIIEMLRCDTPYPVLELIGEQGSAKSTTQAAIRRVVDPNSCDLRSVPKSIDDIFVAATANHVLSYENVSFLPDLMQDAYCIVSTGGGHAKRKLYSDADEITLQVKNPVMINAITSVITAQDLVDRTVTIELPIISNRIEITDLWEIYGFEHASILGAVLDIFANALSVLPEIKLTSEQNPRLIEFAHLGVAVAKVFGLKDDDFLEQFKTLREESIIRTIEASSVATALIAWLDESGELEVKLPTKDLFAMISTKKSQKAWPETPKGFADALRRVIPALRHLGIFCECLGKKGSYVIWKVIKREN